MLRLVLLVRFGIGMPVFERNVRRAAACVLFIHIVLVLPSLFWLVRLVRHDVYVSCS